MPAVYSSTAGEGFKRISFPAWRPSRTAILSPQDVPAFIRTPQNDVTSDPVTPPSGRHVVTPSLSLPRSVFSITQLAMTHRRVRAHTHAHTRSPQRPLTDKNYRLFNFTDSISDLRQLTDSLLRVGCWQATHALFTNQQGFAKHIMHVIWATLKSILN